MAYSFYHTKQTPLELKEFGILELRNRYEIELHKMMSNIEILTRKF